MYEAGFRGLNLYDGGNSILSPDPFLHRSPKATFPNIGFSGWRFAR